MTLITCGLHAAERAEPGAGSQRGKPQTPKSVEFSSSHPGATAYRGEQVAGKQELVIDSAKQSQDAPKQSQNAPKLTRMSELPAKRWTQAEFDPSGIQFFTKVRNVFYFQSNRS